MALCQLTATALNLEFKTAHETADGLPENLRLHDLRHYCASLLIASGLDVKTVSMLVRRAAITLNVYVHT